jgi:hypothetical protein
MVLSTGLMGAGGGEESGGERGGAVVLLLDYATGFGEWRDRAVEGGIP